jgi:membrane protein
MSLREFFRRLYREVVDDAITDSAAQLSFYFLFSLFPFLVFLVTLTAYLPMRGVIDGVIERVAYVMPASALELLRGHLEALVGETRPKLLTGGFLITLWTASRGVDALRKALNLAYDVPESRPFWKTQGIALVMTACSTALILTAFSMFALGGRVGELLAERLEVSTQFHMLWAWLRWPFTMLVVMLAAAVNYYVLPDVKQQFKFITPGSVVGALLWLFSTYAFTQYVEHFGRYNVTYGSIGGVVVLLLWLYLSGLVLIIGGEINSVIEHASTEGKAKGARDVGEISPEAIGTAIPVTAGAAKRADSARRMRWKFWRRRRPPTPVMKGPVEP